MKIINIKNVIKEIETYKNHAENSLTGEDDPIERRLSGEIAAYNAILNIIQDNIKTRLGKGCSGCKFENMKFAFVCGACWNWNSWTSNDE